MRTIVISLLLVLCQPSGFTAQTVSPSNQATNSVGMPKQAVNLPVGTWKYADVLPGSTKPNADSTSSISIKDDGGAWTITTAYEFAQGPVTAVSTVEKGTLVLRKESFKHFLHKDQPWKPVAINLDFTGDKPPGFIKYLIDPDKPVAMDLGGPVFTYPAGWIGCLPLGDGYSTTFRYFDVDRLPITPQAAIKRVQLKFVGMERVTVPAGTFDSYKVELTSADGRSNRETLWIDKDSRM